VRLSAGFLMVLIAGVVQGAPELQIAPLGYQVVQIQAVPGMSRTFDVTARASVRNLGDPALGVTARLASSSPYFIVLDGDLSFGDVPRTAPLRPVISRDTFTLRVILPARRQIHEFIVALHTSLTWTFSCANCGGANRPPLATAGADQTVYVAQLVMLDGSASSDPDAQPLTYSWSFVNRPAGSAASLGNATSVNATFTPDREGEYVVQLVVNDGELSSAPDTVQISTLNSAPVANAGSDRNAIVGELVTLDGSASSDIDGDPLTYAWAVASRPAGSTAEIVDPSEVSARFTPDVAGQYLIELVVDDGTMSSAPDTMTISTSQPNTPPIASAGPDQAARVGDTAQLDGSGSTDADGDPLSYLWSLNTRPPSSTADLQGATTANPTLTIDRPGTYVAQLVVRDGTTDSAPDTVNVSTLNSRPLASAGSNQTVHWGAIVQLDGSGSSDADGDALGFTWAILSRPDGSTAQLSDVNALSPSFTADRPGVYVVQLVVNDGILTSDPANMTVTAENQVPVAGDDTATTTAGTPVTIAVLANDSDADAADRLQVQSVTQPASGTVTFTASNVQYTPASGFVGTATFAYTITDGADTATANVSVTVNAPTANRPPVANAGPDQTVPGGSDVLLDGSQSSDPDGDSLTYAWVMQSIPDGSAAALSGADTAAPRFTADRRGQYTVSLTVADGQGASATDTMQVTALNRDPVAAPDTVTTAVNSAITIEVLANDTDPDGDVLTLSSITQPSNGAAEIQGASVRFTPAVDFSGATTFSYTISDGNGATASAQVSVSVSGIAGEFTFTLTSTEASGFAGGRVLVPFRLVRSAGTMENITVTLAGAPAGLAATAAIVPDNVSDGLLDLAIGRNVAPGTVQLQLAAASASASRTASLTLQVAAPQPSSIELIRAAMLAGELDLPTSLLYRAYALVGDARLPATYRGSGSVEEDTGLFAEIREAMPTLSPEMRAQLQPFILRPSNPDSWYAQLLATLAPTAAPTSSALRARSSLLSTPTIPTDGEPVLPSTCEDDPAASPRWISTRSAENGFRAWAHCVPGAPRAAETVVAEAVKVFDVLWSRMSGDMGPPLPDVPAGTPVNPADGVGDETIDIYVLFPGDVVARLGQSYGGIAHAYGWAQTWNEQSGGRSSGFISIPVTTLLSASFHVTAAHELFHVLQYAHNYQLAIGTVPSGFGGLPNAPRLAWWYVEASAEWAGAHYDRVLAGQLGRGRLARTATYDPWFAGGFQTRASTLSLNAGGQLGGAGAHLPYEAFIWPYFLEQESGDSSRPAGQMWAAVAGAATPKAADERIDGVVPFDTNMRTFAVRNLNNVAVNNRYEALDTGQFPKDTPPEVVYQGHFRAGSPQQIEFSLTTLAAYYIRLDNDVEPNLRKVHLDFTGLDGARADLGIDVDLLLKLKGGGWQSAQNFNGTKKKTWCLDEDDVESIYLVISAHELEEAGVITRQVSIENSASVAPCRPTWVGTSRLSSTQSGGVNVVSMASADSVMFELLGEEDEGGVSNMQPFGVVAGGIAKMEQMIIDCERSPQPPTSPITAENTPGSMLVTYSSDGTQMTVTGSATTFYSGSVIADCSSGERVDEASIAASWLSFGNGITVQVPPPPAQQKIQGSFNVSVAQGTNSILTIDLTLVRQ
jgi:hypothetical protein